MNTHRHTKAVGRASARLPKAQHDEERAEARPTFTRRDFLQTFTGGLAVLWLVNAADLRAQAESGNAGRGGGRGGSQRPRELAAWLRIAADGTVTAFTGKTEFGQNIRTSLTQAIAEELPTPLSSIKLVMADTRLVPHDGGTVGSRTTPDMNLQLRKVAATAREALLDLAAKHWSVERATLAVADGRIRHNASQRTIGFGELTRGEKLVVNVSDRVALKPATQWTIAGTSVPKIDGQTYLTGRHFYTTDIRREGMVHARVLRPPAFGATLVSVDSSAVEGLRGVTIVRDGNLVAATAPTEQLAARAVAALRAEWQTTPQVSERELFAHLKKSARGAPVDPPASELPGTLRATYTVAYIAHAPLEPRAAVAEFAGDQLTVWTGTQRPFGVHTELAQALRIPEDRIRVIVPDTGSGYGGKHYGDAAVEAARIARAAGKPVKLVWTREEEFTWAYFRPAGVMDLTAAVGPDGRITRWEHRNYNSGSAGVRGLYDVPGKVEQAHNAQTPLRQGSYRALASTANHFARESHIDDLARTAQIDPLEFRLKNLTDPRARAVLEAAAKAFGWTASSGTATVPGRNSPERPGTVAVPLRGVGLAVGFEKAGYVGTCAEIQLDPGTGAVRVTRVVQAFECGAIVNPEHLRGQVEGCIVQGLGGALFEAMHFEHGRILNPRFSQYRVPRFSDLPQIEIVLLDRKDIASAGGSEAPIIGIAPAIGNAICDATGIRLRSLPMVPNGLKV